MKKIIMISILCLLGTSIIQAQEIKNPAQWRVEAKRVAQDQVELDFHGEIQPSWIVYAVSVPEDGPLPIALELDPDAMAAASGALIEVTQPSQKHDPMFDMEVNYFAGKFQLKQVLTTEADKVRGGITYQACSDMECIPLSWDFEVDVPLKVGASSISTSGVDAEGGSVLGFFLLAVLAGFLGVLTPCVFPMLPMTISFFIRGNNRKRGLQQVLVFVLSIIAIYTSVGVVIAVTKSPAVTDFMSNHWISNLIFFAMFAVFAISFLGAMEITLPASWTTKLDSKADKGGMFASFFVALALVAVSFSCTGPFLGSLLPMAISGSVLKPVVGMFGFGLAFSLPFALLALFPSAMKKLPKSGGWMNKLKVFFAFVMLIFSMKFLLAIDLGLDLNLISRDIFLAVWVVLFVLMGVYFLGGIRFAHDDKEEHVTVPSFLIGLASLVMALYLFTGFLGNPLKTFSGFIPAPEAQVTQNVVGATPVAAQPAMATQGMSFAPVAIGSLVAPAANAGLCGTPKYSEQAKMHGPAGMPAYFDVDEALACARQQGKKVLIDFKGHFCTNCKKMEGEVLADAQVRQYIQDNFVVVALYTDDKTPLPAEEHYKSGFDGKIKKTLGQKNMDYQMSTYKVNAIPYFVVLNADASARGKGIGYTSNASEFIDFLKK